MGKFLYLRSMITLVCMDTQALVLLPVFIGSNVNNKENKKPLAKRKKSNPTPAEIDHPKFFFEFIEVNR